MNSVTIIGPTRRSLGPTRRSSTTPALGIMGEGAAQIVGVAAGRSMASVIQKSTPAIAGFEAAYDLPRASGRLMMSYGDDVVRAGNTWKNIGIGVDIGLDLYGEVGETILQNRLPRPSAWPGTPMK